MKLVYWQGNGFALWMKRLEKARFKWLVHLPFDVIGLNAQQVRWLVMRYCFGCNLVVIDLQTHNRILH